MSRSWLEELEWRERGGVAALRTIDQRYPEMGTLTFQQLAQLLRKEEKRVSVRDRAVGRMKDLLESFYEFCRLERIPSEKEWYLLRRRMRHGLRIARFFRSSQYTLAFQVAYDATNSFLLSKGRF